MIQPGLVAARAQQADELLEANRTQQLPPLSARSAEVDSQFTKPLSARQTAKLSNKLPRTPSVKQLLGQLEAKLKVVTLPSKLLESTLKQESTSAPEDPAIGKPSTCTVKLAPADVQQCLRNVSMAFGEVIELLPSYRQLLIRVQETYDGLVTRVMEELGSMANLRGRVKALSAQVQRLEGGHRLFPAENSWSEACKLRRHLADRNIELQTLEDECKKLQDKVSKQAAHLRELQHKGFRNRRTLADLAATESKNKQLLAERTKVLAEKRWCNFIGFAMENIPHSECGHDVDISSSAEGGATSPEQPMEFTKTTPEDLPSPPIRPLSRDLRLRRSRSLARRTSLPPCLCVLPLTAPSSPIQPQLGRTESTRSNRSVTSLKSPSGARLSGPAPADDNSMSPNMNLRDAVNSYIVEHHPEKWGISMSQMNDFYNEIKDDLHVYCECHDELLRDGERIHICLEKNCAWHHGNFTYEALADLSHEESTQLTSLSPNMHLVVSRYIKPITAPYSKSYALMMNPLGRKINIFITHVWTDRFQNFVHTLRRALSERDVVWVCSFAMPQNSTDEVQALLAAKDLRDCPFGVALRHAESHVVVLDEDAVVPTRSWCTYEINLGSNLNKPMLLWPHQMHNFDQLHERIELLDMETASATRVEDEERIKADIRAMGGFEALNKRLRSLLHDRIRFAQDVVLAGKQDREGVMHAFRQKLAKEEEEHRKCQLEKAELSQKLQAALDSGNSKWVGEVCQGISGLKMDGYEKACWEGIKKLHLMLEFQPLKADATPVHAMQVMCNSLVRIHRESDVFGHVDWGKTFSSAFERELDKKGLVNIQEDVVKFIAQVKPPGDFSSVFLPQSCRETWLKFGQRQAEEKADHLVHQRSFETDRRVFQDRLTDIDQRINTETLTTPCSVRSSTPSESHQISVLSILRENQRDVMFILEVLARSHAQKELEDRAHRDELEKKEVASRRTIEELRANIQELRDGKDEAIREARSLERALNAETVEEKLVELRQEMLRITADRDASLAKLEDMGKQHMRLQFEVESMCNDNEAMKEEVRKDQALAERWQKEAERLKSELMEQTSRLNKTRTTMHEWKMKSVILELKPQEQVKTPAVAMKILCNALVRTADEHGLGRGWYDNFQEFFKKALKDIPSQKEDIETFICSNGGAQFQSRFLSYRNTSNTSRRRSNKRFRTTISKENLGEKLEDPLESLDIFSDWEDEEDRPSSAPDLTRSRNKTLKGSGSSQRKIVTLPIAHRKTSQL